MPGDEEQVRNLFDKLIGAWNARDASTMASLYAPQGGQVGFDGSTFNSPAEIEKTLAPIFKDHPTARFVTIVREVRGVGKDAMILRAVAGMVPPGSRDHDRTNTIQTLVASRTGKGMAG